MHPSLLPENSQKKMEAELFIQASILLTYGLTDPFPVQDNAWLEDLVEVVTLYFDLAIPS